MLTKTDLKQISELVDKKFDRLLIIFKKGFEQINKRFDQIDERFNRILEMSKNK